MDDRCRIADCAASYLQTSEHWTQGQYTNLTNGSTGDGEKDAYDAMEPGCRVCMIGSLIYACKHLRMPLDRTYVKLRSDLYHFIRETTAADGTAEFNDTAPHWDVSDTMKEFALRVCSEA